MNNLEDLEESDSKEDWIEVFADNKIVDQDPWSNEISAFGRVGIGPIEVRYRIEGDRIKLEIYVLEIRIGSGTIDANNNKICLGAKVKHLIKINICIVADFSKKDLLAEGKYCHKKPNGKYRCKNFSHRIAGW